MTYSLPPGVFDIIPEDTQEPWKSTYLWNYVEDIIRNIASLYGYQEIRTPILEHVQLFQRGVGATTDVVSKEMYTFKDRGDRTLALRPEGTAPAMRALIEHHLPMPQKLFYIAPMFRYERSQAGRYRQHHQFGAEAVGHATSEQDGEIIDFLYSVYQRLGLKKLSLNINTLGDAKARSDFRQALITYLTPHLSSLSTESQNRLTVNPLRILDSKDPRDRLLVAQAPSILDFIDSYARDRFESLLQLLNLLKIPYQINPLLVRGLDYYNQMVFEVVAGELGAQNSVGGGGRYDGLLGTLGGQDTPAVGFGTGIERIIQTMLQQQVQLPEVVHPQIFLIGLGNAAKQFCYQLLHELRQNNIVAQMDFSDKKIGKILTYANQQQVEYVAIIGDNEINANEINLKEMKSGHQTTLPLSEVLSFFIKNNN